MNRWKIGTKIWFGFYILLQWLMAIEYATKPITRYNTEYQKALVIYVIIAMIGTGLIVWLIASKSRTALKVILLIAGINAFVNLVSSGIGVAIASLIVPGITWLLTHETVE